MTDLPTGQRLRILQLLIAHGERTAAELLDLDPELPRGTIYTTLRRLKDVGLVARKARHNPSLSGPSRVFYRITALGERAAKMGELAEAVMAGSTIRI